MAIEGNGRRILGSITKSPWFIVGVALLAIPETRKALRPLAVAGVKAVVGLGEGARRLVSGTQETLEDIVAEARYENLKRSMENDSLGERMVATVTETASQTSNIVHDAIENTVQ